MSPILSSIRTWLLCKLAGKTTVVINAHLIPVETASYNAQYLAREV